MQNFDFYIEQLSVDLNSYELKMFRVQHDEIQLSTYSDTKQFFEYAEPDYDEGCRFLYFPLN